MGLFYFHTIFYFDNELGVVCDAFFEMILKYRMTVNNHEWRSFMSASIEVKDFVLTRPDFMS